VLCDHPDQWALLGQHPELAVNAVEELIRHSPLTFVTLRAATEDVELAGVQIPSGAIVVVNTGAANRILPCTKTPTVSTSSARVPHRSRRSGAACTTASANLARLELAEALAVMTRRMPNARRTGPAPWKPVTALGGPITLLIEFDTD
jgi:cytochrome P450